MSTATTWRSCWARAGCPPSPPWALPSPRSPAPICPGFAPPAVEGHAGTISSIDASGVRTLVFLGRTHYYEGRGVAAVVHGVRMAAAAGCRAIVLTNGCGGLRPQWSPGTPVLIKDHINLTATSPIVGARFVDLTDLYSSRLRALCTRGRPKPRRGRLRPVPRPALRDPGRDRAWCGPSAATSSACPPRSRRSPPARPGMEVLGISLVTNAAAGMSGEPLDHEEVLAAGQAAAARMGDLLGRRRGEGLSGCASC
ncbi:MAG: purine-nucleoside phosphorylase [Nocardioidaceae bacterium]